jgi:hypothetical protein
MVDRCLTIGEGTLEVGGKISPGLASGDAEAQNPARRRANSLGGLSGSSSL